MDKLEESWTDRDVHPLVLKKNHRPEVQKHGQIGFREVGKRCACERCSVVRREMKGKTRDLRKVAMTATAVVAAAIATRSSSSRHSWHHGSSGLSFFLSYWQSSNQQTVQIGAKHSVKFFPKKKKNELIVQNNTLGEHFLKMWDQLKTIIIIVFLPSRQAGKQSQQNKTKQS